MAYPHFDELMELAYLINSNVNPDYVENMKIVFNVSKNYLDTINQGLFMKNNPASNEKPDDADEVVLNFGGVHFIFDATIEKEP